MFVIIGNFHGYFMPFKENHSGPIFPLYFSALQANLSWLGEGPEESEPLPLVRVSVTEQISPVDHFQAWVAPSEKPDNIPCPEHLKDLSKDKHTQLTLERRKDEGYHAVKNLYITL